MMIGSGPQVGCYLSLRSSIFERTVEASGVLGRCPIDCETCSDSNFVQMLPCSIPFHDCVETRSCNQLSSSDDDDAHQFINRGYRIACEVVVLSRVLPS